MVVVRDVTLVALLRDDFFLDETPGFQRCLLGGGERRGEFCLATPS